ncbi:RnfABCDGE type electron transport complex subunit G [Candidatus Ozemobacteraceae bacterium]|nr:RnfABCDGE type electron transport complex subunit G [Candidatus Ozemobacteraceae bacterium]
MNTRMRGHSDLYLVMILTLFSAVSGLLLALVNTITKDRIAQVAIETQKKALTEIIPEFDATEVETILPDPMDPFELIICKKAGAITGIAIKLSSRLLSPQDLQKLSIAPDARQDPAYSDPIKLLVGFTPDRKISGVSVIQCRETPGLGTKINTKQYKSNFAGYGIDEKTWLVKKDGGNVEQITAATISSRAMTSTVAKAIAIFKARATALNLSK